MYRFYFLLLSIVTISFSGLNPIDDAIAVIMTNRVFIQSRIVQTPSNNSTFTKHKIRYEQLIASANSDSSMDFKIGIMKQYVSNISDFAKIIGGTRWITDSINIHILTNLLRCNIEQLAEISFHELLNNASFEALMENSNYIKNKILLSDLIRFRKYSLLSLLKPTASEKDSIFNFNVTLDIKARTGDKKSLDSLVKLYKNSAFENRAKEIYALQLMQTGLNEAVKVVLSDFSKPFYFINKSLPEKPCTNSTFQSKVMVQLQRYHPYDKFIAEQYDNVFSFGDINTQAEKNEVMSFWKGLHDWIFTNYQVKIDTLPPFMNIFRPCRTYGHNK